MDIRKVMGANVRRLRRAKGFSQEKLAFECGVHRTYVSGVERGVRNPTIRVVAKIAVALDAAPAELLASTGCAGAKPRDEDFVTVGESKGVSPRDIGRHWHKLGSFLHIRMPKKKGDHPKPPDEGQRARSAEITDQRGIRVRFRCAAA